MIGYVVVLASVLATCAEKPKETKLTPTLVLSGSHSVIKREAFFVVTDEAGWKDLWKRHRGDKPDQRFTESEQALKIDFDTHYVAAIITGWDSSLVVTTFTRDNAVLLRFSAHGYQTIVPLVGFEDRRTEHEKAKEKAISDYTFVVLPKPVKTVIVEKDVRRRLDYPPLWKEQSRFPAPKDNP